MKEGRKRLEFQRQKIDGKVSKLKTDKKDRLNTISKMAKSGEKTTRNVDEMMMSELRSALNEIELPTKGSLTVLRNRNAHSGNKKTGDTANNDNDDMDDDPEDDDVDVDLLSKDELQTRLRR